MSSSGYFYRNVWQPVELDRKNWQDLSYEDLFELSKNEELDGQTRAKIRCALRAGHINYNEAIYQGALEAIQTIRKAFNRSPIKNDAAGLVIKVDVGTGDLIVETLPTENKPSVIVFDGGNEVAAPIEDWLIRLLDWQEVAREKLVKHEADRADRLQAGILEGLTQFMTDRGFDYLPSTIAFAERRPELYNEAMVIVLTDDDPRMANGYYERSVGRVVDFDNIRNRYQVAIDSRRLRWFEPDQLKPYTPPNRERVRAWVVMTPDGDVVDPAPEATDGAPVWYGKRVFVTSDALIANSLLLELDAGNVSGYLFDVTDDLNFVFRLYWSSNIPDPVAGGDNPLPTVTSQ